MEKLSAILGLAGCAWTFAVAKTVEPEKNAACRALFSANPESDDLTGHAFRNQSAAANAILGNCLPGRLYKLGQGTMRAMDNTTR